MDFKYEQIKEAHSKVKSGADFPNFLKELNKLGVLSYETFVNNGSTIYIGKNGYTVNSLEKYSELIVADQPNIEQFMKDLRNHQQGNTDYLTFCSDCAKSGVEKWAVNIENRTCIYFDKNNHSMLIESLPL